MFLEASPNVPRFLSECFLFVQVDTLEEQIANAALRLTQRDADVAAERKAYEDSERRLAALQEKVRVGFREHSGTFGGHSGNIQEHSGNIQGTFGEHSGNIRGRLVGL
jgi:hypothetical protein